MNKNPDVGPAQQMKPPADWIAIFCRHSAWRLTEFTSESEANRFLDCGENQGECYGVATYHVPSGTLTMRDPLRMDDEHRLRKIISVWLTKSTPDKEPI